MELTALVQNPIVGRAAEMAIAALWQGALIAGALAICLRLLPHVSAAYRFAAWSAAFVVLAGLSLFSLVPHTSIGASQAAVHAQQGHALQSKLGVNTTRQRQSLHTVILQIREVPGDIGFRNCGIRRCRIYDRNLRLQCDAQHDVR